MKNTLRQLKPAALVVVALLVATAASAQEVRVVTSGGFTEAYKQLAPQFERDTHIKVISAFGASMGATPDAIPNRLKRGEPIDVIILAAPGLDSLIKDGMVDPGTRVDLVRSLIAMAVKTGAPKPDISTLDAFKRALLQAKSIGSSDSASGVYLRTELFPRLGIADAIKGKSKVIEAYERVGDAVARGDIEVGFQQVSELKPVPGITIVGPLPEGAQQVTIFSAAIPKGAKAPDAARRLIEFLSSPAAAPVVEQTGLEPIRRQGGPEGPPLRPSALVGAIDIHVHTEPDSRPRSVDGIEAAQQAKAKGMRAIVLKNHYEYTSGLAYIVGKQVPGIEVFGGVDLNLTVGGMNPAAVEYMAATTGGRGRLVWMSTFDAENQVRFSKENRPFVSVSKSGQLLQATKDVIASIAKHNLVLATGHVSPEEGLMLVREAKRQGVQRIVITHAMNDPIGMSVPQMQEAARLGALIEFVGGNIGDADGKARMDRFADAIRKIGPQFCILSSDLGQKGNPLPTDGFAAFLGAMKARGLTDEDVDRMARRNPAQLLGLSAR
jgi:ABC-type molybdate transport system substrate-binding protein